MLLGKQINKIFWKKLAVVLICALIVSVIFHFLREHYIIAIGHQDCLNYKVFIVKKGLIPKKNEFVCIRTSGIPFYPDGTRLMKLVVGTGGERIRVSSEDSGKIVTLTVSGKQRSYKLKGYLILETEDRNLKLPVFEYGSRGQKLPFVWKDGDTSNEFFVVGTHPASYDSRYFGTIDEKMVIGRAYPIF